MSIQQNFPGFSPSLNLNFARSKRLDPRVTFVRQTGATVTNELGLLERVGNNIPRFDHVYDASTGAVRSLGLLIEEQRENLVDYSNDFTQLWSQPDIITANDTISPDGTLNAAKVTNDSNTNNFNFAGYRVFAGTKTTYTYSFFIKDDDSGAFSIIVGTEQFNSGTGTYARNTFNFSTKTFTTFQYVGQESGYVTNQTYEEYPNGWFRIITTFDTSSFTSTQTQINFGFYQGVYGSTSSYYQKSLYTWGHQLEVGAFPTSYIPTTGLPTTRLADRATIDGQNFSSWYNQIEGTYFISTKIAHTPNPNVAMLFLVGNSAGARVSIEQTTSNTLTEIITNSGSYFFQPSGGGILSANEFRKTSLSYISTNGITTIGTASNLSTLADTASSIDVNKSMNILYLGRYTDTFYYLNGHIQQFVYYPRKISNSQLQQLTR